jgi:hypothetical protein
MLSLLIVASCGNGANNLEGARQERSLPTPAPIVALNATHDYIIPPATAASAAAAQATPAVQDGETVTYVTFFGETLTMQQFNGLHTALLVKPSDLAQAGIDRIRRLVDEHDIIYETLQDLTGGEPTGEGLLRIAVVDNTCGGGCGYIGAKGVEILTPVLFFQDYIAYVDHELTHNFDRRSSFLFNSHDIAHSWTAFADQYSQVYPRRAFNRLDADDVLALRIHERLGPYEALPGASWQTCVRDATCDPPGDIGADEMAVLAEGGPILRVAQIYGPHAMRGWMRTVDRLIGERGLDAGAMTAQDRIDLLVESLSLTVGADLSCFYDFWHWPLSAGLRARLAVLGSNALCLDRDCDGFTPIAHDCNDANPTVNPAAKEIVNGVDDDCDSIVDDLLVSEPPDFPPSTSPLSVPLPVHVRGHLDATDEDAFRVRVPARSTVRFTVDSLNTAVGTLFVNLNGTGVATSQPFAAGRTSILKLDVSPGDWRFFLDTFQSPGDYDVTVHVDYKLDMAADFWPITFTSPPGQVSPDDPRVVILPVPPVPPELAGTLGLYAQYWISSLGYIGLVGSMADTFTFIAPEGTDLNALTYRVHFGVDGIPLSPLSQPGPLLGAAPPAR